MAESTLSVTPLLDGLAAEVVEVAQRKLGAYRTVRSGKKSYRRRAVSTGTLKNSLSYSIRQSGSLLSISFGASGKAKDYFRAVNDGRKKGTMPPLSALVKWIEDKPIRLRSGGKFVKTTEKGKIRLAYAIGQKIKRDGIAPFPYYSEAIQEVLERKTPEILEELSKQIEIELKKWQ